MRELPLNTQIKYVKENMIPRMIKLYQVDKFTSEDLRRPGIPEWAPITSKRINPLQVIRNLALTGDVIILKDENNIIEFKITEKFGEIQGIQIEIPRSYHTIEAFKENYDEMVKAYGIIANIENRLRILIKSKLESKGDDWLINSLSTKRRDKLEDKKRKAYGKLHQEAPKEDIQYTDFKDLRYIITNNWSYFKDVFIEQDIITNPLKHLETPRNTIAHSNVLSKKMYEDLNYHSNKINELIDKYESK